MDGFIMADESIQMGCFNGVCSVSVVCSLNETVVNYVPVRLQLHYLLNVCYSFTLQIILEEILCNKWKFYFKHSFLLRIMFIIFFTGRVDSINLCLQLFQVLCWVDFYLISLLTKASSLLVWLSFYPVLVSWIHFFSGFVIVSSSTNLIGQCLFIQLFSTKKWIVLGRLLY